jgi:hypothetical protein
MSISTPNDDYMMQNPKSAFIDEAIHSKSIFIYEAICANNELNPNTYPSHLHHQQQKWNKMLVQHN